MAVDASLLPAAFALAGALGSQFVSAILSRRTKRLELVYTRKADAYRELLEQAGKLAHAANKQVDYPEYIRALVAARLVASAAVEEAISGPGSLDAAVQELRAGDPGDYFRREEIIDVKFGPRMESVVTLMAEELRKLV